LLAAAGARAKIYDAKDERGSAFTAQSARSHALAVFSPGFAPEHPWLVQARAAGVVCLGELDFTSLFWRGRIVAITGTNGKTTLTEFITHALSGIGRTAFAASNTGHSFSKLVVAQRGGAPDAIAVCEVDSFQAETLRHLRADALLWSNFAEDHLDRHLNLEAYFGAKWTLVACTDAEAVFVGSSVQRHARKYDRPLPTMAAVPTEGQPAIPALARTVFAEYPQRENYLLARAWWRAGGLLDEQLVAAARTFRLGRHRLARVLEHEGVTYWNDSKATNFHAVEAALAGFSAPVVLIAGGHSKVGDLAGFAHRIAPRVKHVVLIGETSAELGFHLSTFRVSHTACALLDEAVSRAAELAERGDHVLLSPGFASFDLFRSYEDRGDQFEHLVRDLEVTAPSLK
jgi:UDP-N-acetylmuramoylalanine--D-glutamate ligase